MRAGNGADAVAVGCVVVEWAWLIAVMHAMEYSLTSSHPGGQVLNEGTV